MWNYLRKSATNLNFPKRFYFLPSGFTLAFCVCAEKSGPPLVTWTERRPWWSLSSCSTSAATSSLLTSPHIKLKKKSRRGKGELLALPCVTLRSASLCLEPPTGINFQWCKIIFGCASEKKKRSVGSKRRRSGNGRDRRRRGVDWRRRRGLGEMRKSGVRRRRRDSVWSSRSKSVIIPLLHLLSVPGSWNFLAATSWLLLSSVPILTSDSSPPFFFNLIAGNR